MRGREGRHVAHRPRWTQIGNIRFVLVKPEGRLFGIMLYPNRVEKTWRPYSCPLPAEVGCFRLRPLHRVTEIGYTRLRLRERAARSLNKQRLGEGVSTFESSEEAPSPNRTCCTPSAALSRKGEGADTSTAFHDAARLLPEDVAPHFGGG